MFRNHFRHTRSGGSERGQLIVMAAVAMVAIIAMTGLVIDGSHAWSQRRGVQNAADLASLAGARVVGMHNFDPTGTVGTDADVKGVIEDVLADNGMSTTPCDAVVTQDCYAAQYVDDQGEPIFPAKFVGGGTIPSDAAGVRVEPTTQMDTFFMQIVGFEELTARAPATSRASGYAGTFGGPGGNLLPIAVTLDEQYWNDHYCGPQYTAAECTPVELNEAAEGEGHNGLPGQFNWMSWSGEQNSTYSRHIIGPPANSPVYQVPRNNHMKFSGNTGVSNTLKSNIDQWVDEQRTIIVPITSPGPPDPGQNCTTQPERCYPDGTPYPEPGQGTGSSATYNVIGFAGFELTGCGSPCIKNLEGVFRMALFNGPTGTGPGNNGLPGEEVGIQLVH